MIDLHRYETLKSAGVGYGFVVLVCVTVVALGGYCALHIEHAGHVITGMNNHIVWGLPHVFAVSLIVCASGALNGASLASVFGVHLYKPLARVSIVLAMCLLLGGLLVLVLDLGRPDRLIIALTTYNFRSVFSWNIILYTGFLLICALYLWSLVERRNNRYISGIGKLAFVWRIVLTSATGSIFGLLVGRNALDSALLAPLFIALSLVIGTSVFSLFLVLVNRWRSNLLTESLILSLCRLLVWFLLALVYFSIVQRVTNAYIGEHQRVEQYILHGGLSAMFWVGHVAIGVLMPLGLLLLRTTSITHLRRLVIGSSLSLLGGLALMYIIIIGSQSTPQELFPGKTVLASRFGDAGFPSYEPSSWEWGLGLGGVSMALLLCLLALRVLPLLPEVVLSSDEPGR